MLILIFIFRYDTLKVYSKNVKIARITRTYDILLNILYFHSNKLWKFEICITCLVHCCVRELLLKLPRESELSMVRYMRVGTWAASPSRNLSITFALGLLPASKAEWKRRRARKKRRKERRECNWDFWWL